MGTWKGDPPPGGPNLPSLFTKKSVAAPVTGGGVPGRGLKSDQPPGSLWTPPRAGHNNDTGGGELNVRQVPPLLHVCVTHGPQRPTPRKFRLTQGEVTEVVPPNGGGGGVQGQ